MNLMLLCAGEGTRLRPHTLTLPKPAIPFLGVPMAAYSLEWAREVSPEKLVVNTYHLGPKIHALFSSLEHGFSRVHFSDETTLMGSGGGVSLARSGLRDSANFLVMNGDEVTLPTRPGSLARARERHESAKRLATLIVMDYPGVGTKFGGVWVDAENRVLGFGKTPVPGAVRAWHYIGPTFLAERVFDLLPENQVSNLLYDALVAGIQRGDSVGIEVVEGWWHETGNETDLLAATRDALPLLERKDAQGNFLRSVLDRHAKGWRMENGVLRWPKSVIDKSAHLEGACVIGPGARVGASARLTNAVLGTNASLGDGEVLENQMRL